MRFGSWLAMPAADLVDVPKKAGCFQVRMASGLLAYPRGKSAMLAYGAAATAAEAYRGFLHSPAQTRAAKYGGLLIRFAEPDPHGGTPEQQIDRLRRRFIEQFGAPPAAESTEEAAAEPISDSGLCSDEKSRQ